MIPDFSNRAMIEELMDDLSRPEEEFRGAYRELGLINRYLGGIRAVERFMPKGESLLILDVAAGACDIDDALIERRHCRAVAADRNVRGLKLARQALPVVADAFELPFREQAFDVVTASLFFHHLTNPGCARVLREMYRLAKRLVIVNDLHRHRAAYLSICLLTQLFSRSAMVRHDGPVSVRRAFRPQELLEIAWEAGVPARVYRSFPYRLVLVAEKQKARQK